jgi:hypothetical protein
MATNTYARGRNLEGVAGSQREGVMRRFGLVLGLVVASLSVPLTSEASTVSFGTYIFTQSDAFGTGSFGSVTVSNLGGGVANVSVNMSPNYILDTGSHWAGTFSLAGAGTVDPNAFGTGHAFSSTHFSLATGGSFSNSPFGTFTSAIQADCTKGNCGPTLGISYSFHILNFAGLVTATNLFHNLAIAFAVDISRFGCSGYGCTGVVGAVIGDNNTPPPPVPLPPALLLFGSALIGLGVVSRRRRRTADRSL